MDEVIAHVQENLRGYLVSLGCAIPIILIFRKHTIPFIALSIDSVVYASVFHVMLSGVVRFFGWFRKESSFEALADGSRRFERTFTTPITEAWWDKALYHPEWLMNFEIVCAVLIILATFRYRPLDVGRKNTYRGKAAAQASKQQRAGQRGRPKYTRGPRRK